MVNPHWDEEITEDIGLRRPHFNPYPGHETWSPQGEFGQHGEFSGSRREEVLPSPNMPGSWRGGDEGWGNYPADEFTGIQSNVPSGGGFLRNIFDMFGGNIPGLGGGFQTRNRNRFNPEPGPWNEFNPRSPYGPPTGVPADWGEGLMAELSGQQEDWMGGAYGSPDYFSNFDDYFDAVTSQEDKGPWWQFGGGAQEPATEQEVIDQLKKTYQGRLPWTVA